MGAPEDEHIFGVQLRESADDGSDFPNADADYRKLFLGEDGDLHLKDSAGSVTTVGGAIASLDDVGDVNAPSPSNGEVLTWDSTPGEWVAAAGGGGGGALVLLEQHTASSSSSLDFTTFISSTYDEYVFEFVHIVPATDNVQLLMRMGTGGGPTYAATNYAFGAFRWSNSGTATAGGTSGQTAIGIDGIGGIDNGANSALAGHVRFFDPQAAIHSRVEGQVGYTDNSGSPVGSIINGTWLDTTAITAVRFLMSSGNIASGTIRVYGVAK